jgi:hypothetical protein
MAMSEVEHERRRNKLFARLGEYFPQGATVERFKMYIKDLRRERFRFDTVEEAVERIIKVRDKRTFPSYAEVRNMCITVKAEWLRARRQEQEKAERGEQADPPAGLHLV